MIITQKGASVYVGGRGVQQLQRKCDRRVGGVEGFEYTGRKKMCFFINQGQEMPRFDAASRHGLTHLSAKFEVKKLKPEQFLSQNWKVLKKHKVKKL